MFAVVAVNGVGAGRPTTLTVTTAAAPSPSVVPSAPSAPSGATAVCRDGTFSYSQNHSGTCSHHGGVSRWL
ncbi:MAG: DUF3761 domain-containing protein [bacterium]|nr:DUF3761 domain-containing protein [bacterium]